MSLNHYGVAIGSLVSFTRDPQHDFGHWYHGHVQLDAAGTPWTSALDVDAPSAVGVLYRLVTDLHVSDLGPVGSLSNGFHELLHTDASGALDYVRSHALRDGWMVRWIRDRVLKQRAPADWSPPPANVGKPGGPDPAAFAPAPFGPHPIDSWLEKWLRWTHAIPVQLLRLVPLLRWRSFPWIESNGDNALDALAPHLASSSRVYVYGQRYTDGTNGVHDVHMNQGDPAGSQWYAYNGTWQDGGVACQRADDGVVIWQVRFKTQSITTDDNGNPR